MNDDRLRRCFDAGTSVLVATVDARNTPACVRAIALAAAGDLATATVYVPIATSQLTIQNLATTQRLSVAATHPVDHCSVQLKGTAGAVRLARPDEETWVRSRLDAFADVLHAIGIPRRLIRSVAHWPAFAIEMRVAEVFDQTPGPNAGSRLR